ncbi:AGE family epimerase/isomerase [Leeuwenhoekiella aequorea]|uniref:AGE family epimerase/isomerase n=1 Tax=Leeuwenhoekiella TaxID=283735 RepID=UPI00048F22DB|nr:AGE family epimerase/isomerase [Leeuwenhoekiella sp. MAR_2009_132]|tara:strand:+ start:13236 stop:14573 length:1338 start_codon:yes stop_codon:yes gene_type:complete
MKILHFFSLFCLTTFTAFAQEKVANEAIISQMKVDAKENLLDKWYPLVIDKEDGGYYSEITYDFQVGEKHDKMIVTQARHIWTNSVAAEFFPDKQNYLNYAAHGFEFLRDVMWDAKYGGFHNLVTKEGKPIAKKGEEKTAYGNSFAMYGLAAYYRVSGNKEALDLAKKTFYWLEEHSHDPKNKGYFQSLNLDGSPILRDSSFDSTSDVGYKDQNSSIHLLEAFTELYKVWPDKLVAERLEELLLLIRDTIVSERYYMNLFFEADWTPVSFNEETKEIIKKHYYLDHVSFGHDVEIAYLMLEASEILERKDIEKTLLKGKMMVDHALENGWDPEFGGFYDGGYYFGEDKSLTIVNSDKNWWSQAEGLNTLLIMQHYFPNDSHHYGIYFNQLWEYVNTFFMDDRFGGWYEWGQDNKPETKDDLKGHIWKANYHNFRALINCLKNLEK